MDFCYDWWKADVGIRKALSSFSHIWISVNIGGQKIWSLKKQYFHFLFLKFFTFTPLDFCKDWWRVDVGGKSGIFQRRKELSDVIN